MKNKIFAILGACLLILSFYWYHGLKDFKRGKFFYMAEGQLIFSYGAGLLGLIFLALALDYTDISFKQPK